MTDVTPPLDPEPADLAEDEPALYREKWSQCGCLNTVRLAPNHLVVGQSPDR